MYVADKSVGAQLPTRVDRLELQAFRESQTSSSEGGSSELRQHSLISSILNFLLTPVLRCVCLH